jgi:Uma2 family endonuclease
MAGHPKTLLTPDQYLEMDRKSDVRLEYYFGEVFDMAGGTPQHSALKVNLIALLRDATRGKRCRVYDSDLRICVDAANHYTYADAILVCEPLQSVGDKLDTLANPSVIFEVLSPSTEAYDRGDKFRMYRGIESLKEYVLISQKDRQVERFLRRPDGTWLMTAFQQDAILDLETAGCVIPLRALYEDIELEAN